MTLRTVPLPTAPLTLWTDFSWPSKAPGDVLDYQVDATRWLADAGLALLGAEVAGSAGLAISPPSIAAGVVTLRISGGVPDTTAAVRVLLYLGGDEQLEVVVRLVIRAAAPGDLVGVSSGDPAPALFALVL